jgi:hypothetical protein
MIREKGPIGTFGVSREVLLQNGMAVDHLRQVIMLKAPLQLI